MSKRIPGYEGTMGPFPDQYSEPHVYARDTFSGAGNCVCGSGLGDWVHIQAAPGVEMPERLRPARSQDRDNRPGLVRVREAVEWSRGTFAAPTRPIQICGPDEETTR
jgi:hypothetical protein